jgi:hypothetical protein
MVFPLTGISANLKEIDSPLAFIPLPLWEGLGEGVIH